MHDGCSEIEVMGEYWEPTRVVRTDLGRLVEAAKGDDDGAAADRLAVMAADWMGRSGLAAHTLLVAVPASPSRPNRLLGRIVPRIAALGGWPTGAPVERRHDTSPLRELEPDARPAAARAAGYAVERRLDGVTVALLDDVVLTGTTLHHVGALLEEAGATVRCFALARSRRQPSG